MKDEQSTSKLRIGCLIAGYQVSSAFATAHTYEAKEIKKLVAGKSQLTFSEIVDKTDNLESVLDKLEQKAEQFPEENKRINGENWFWAGVILYIATHPIKSYKAIRYMNDDDKYKKYYEKKEQLGKQLERMK